MSASPKADSALIEGRVASSVIDGGLTELYLLTAYELERLSKRAAA